MEIIGDIITIILLGVIFFYQRHKINSLVAQIKSQKGILDSAETFFKLFDLEKLKGYGEILAEKARAEAGLRIKQIEADLEGTLKTHEDFKEKARKISKEYVILFEVFFKHFLELPSKTRKKLIDDMGQGMTKGVIEKINDFFEKESKKARIEAITLAFKGDRETEE